MQKCYQHSQNNVYVFLKNLRKFEKSIKRYEFPPSPSTGGVPNFDKYVSISHNILKKLSLAFLHLHYGHLIYSK